MMAFQCFDCAHTWQHLRGEDGRDTSWPCPECGSRNIRRVGKGRKRRGHAYGFGNSDWSPDQRREQRWRQQTPPRIGDRGRRR